MTKRVASLAVCGPPLSPCRSNLTALHDEAELANMAVEELFGRDRLDGFLWSELLNRKRASPQPLPVVVLAGPRGSGKTSVLKLLAERSRRQEAQPFAPVLDLASDGRGDQAWQLIDWFARQLGGRSWPKFGRLRFPRFALGRIIAEGAVQATTLQQTHTDVLQLMRQAAGLDQIAAGMTDITQQLPGQLLGIPTGAAWVRWLGSIGARMVNNRLAAQLRFHTGMAFYGEALSHQANGGFNALVALSRLRVDNTPEARARVDELLCRAFLTDLAEAYRRGFRPRNCLILIDNIDAAGVGEALIKTLVKAKTKVAAEVPDPLLVVAATRRTTPLTLLTTGTPDTPVEQALRPDTQVRLEDVRPEPPAPPPWLYPIRLTDFDENTVEELTLSLYPGGASWVGFVYSLTRGHPWSVVRTLATLNSLAGTVPGPLGERELRAVLDSPCPGEGGKLGDVAAGYLLLDELDEPLRSQMPACAAALDVVTAQQAGLAGEHVLHSELGQRLWLIPGAVPADGDTVLHPWVRRLLLRLLMSAGEAGGSLPGRASTRNAALQAARRVCPPGTAAALYYDLALGYLDLAVD